MRQAFIKRLVELAKADPRIVLMTGDLGYMSIEPFVEAFPDRFFNCGVAEQNMVGMATGMAEAGLLPFVYSIVTFASLRPFEFIRNGPVNHNLPVRIVAIGGGVEYGHNGPTHYGLEDVGAMRLLPGLTVVAPADPQQAASALSATWNAKGPVYFRLGKDEKTIVPGLDGRFELGRAVELSGGDGVLLISMGGISAEAAKARELLANAGVQATHWVAASVEPAPTAQILDALGRHRLIVTVEAHRSHGGFGSIVSEIAAEHSSSCRVIRCGIDTDLHGRSGSQSFIEALNGISAEALVKTILCELDRGL